MTSVRIGTRGASASSSCAVAAGEVGDGADLALAPEDLVGEGGDVGHVDAGADDDPAGSASRAGPRDQLADGGEDDRGVELLWRSAQRAAGPLGALLAGERLARLVARAREGEQAPALEARDLGDQQRGGAEAVQAETLGLAVGPCASPVSRSAR